MFETLIVQPIFNLLVLVYALVPGHNFGLSIIIFTIIVRLLMWPLVKKQMGQTKALRELQPELKRIKQQTKGNRQQESLMVMALYKEKGISPFGAIKTMVVQIIILLGLYSGLSRVINNPEAIIEHSYSWVRNLSWMKELAGNIQLFDNTLFGVVDLSRAAQSSEGIYWSAMLIVLASVIAQYYQSKQLMPSDKEARSLRTILKEAGTGKQAEQAEVQAATGRTMRIFLPLIIFFVSVGLAAAISLYWLVSGVVGYAQQAKLLNEDKEKLTDMADKTDGKKVIEGEIVTKKTKSSKKKTTKKRRKK